MLIKNKKKCEVSMSIKTPLKFLSALAVSISFTLANAETSLSGLSSTFQTKAQNLQVHLNGESGFVRKLDLVKNALPKTTIQLAYFIFEDDYTASALASELIEKAESGNKVQILVDYYMSESYLPWLSHLASTPNIEIKRFRPPTRQFLSFLKKDLQIENPDMFIKALTTGDQNLILKALMSSPIIEKNMAQIKLALRSTKEFSIASLPFILSQLKGVDPSLVSEFRQHLTTFTKRMHHKLLIADTENGTEFIIGGRNISDEYHVSVGHPFLKNRSYPFFDSEISGAIDQKAAEEFKESFSKLWANSTLIKNVTPIKSEELENKLKKNTALFEKQYDDYAQTALIGNLSLGDAEMVYTENGPSSAKSSKKINQTWVQLINKAEHQIDIVSAYFYFTDDMFKAIKAAAERNVIINIKTNSFTSTDMNIVNIASYKSFANWKKLIGANLTISELQKNKGEGSLHAKIINIDNKFVGIGSANSDPRTQLHDTNNLVVLNLESQPETAQKIFDAYVSPAGLHQLTWVEVTEQMAQYIYQKAISEKKELKQMLELKDFIDQL